MLATAAVARWIAPQTHQTFSLACAPQERHVSACGHVPVAKRARWPQWRSSIDHPTHQLSKPSPLNSAYCSALVWFLLQRCEWTKRTQQFSHFCPQDPSPKLLEVARRLTAGIEPRRCSSSSVSPATSKSPPTAPMGISSTPSPSCPTHPGAHHPGCPGPCQWPSRPPPARWRSGAAATPRSMQQSQRPQPLRQQELRRRQPRARGWYMGDSASSCCH